jgi:hypothetical protein
MYFMNPLSPTSLRLPWPNKPSQLHVVLGLLALPSPPYWPTARAERSHAPTFQGDENVRRVLPKLEFVNLK